VAARHRGGITKAGNPHARRALIAWTYRVHARVSRKLYDGLEAVPQNVRDMTSCGQREAEGCRYDRDRTRNGGFHLGHRLSGSAAGNLIIRSKLDPTSQQEGAPPAIVIF
jgi:hypothetical protein